MYAFFSRPPCCMELDGARDLSWSLVVRSGCISLPRTRLVLVQHGRGHEAARARREEFYPIVFGDLAHISKILCHGETWVARVMGHPDIFVCLDVAEQSTICSPTRPRRAEKRSWTRLTAGRRLLARAAAEAYTLGGAQFYRQVCGASPVVEHVASAPCSISCVIISIGITRCGANKYDRAEHGSGTATGTLTHHLTGPEIHDATLSLLRRSSLGVRQESHSTDDMLRVWARVHHFVEAQQLGIGNAYRLRLHLLIVPR